MNLKKIGIVFFLIFCLFPISHSNAQTSNAGFIPSNIWYSKDPFEEGDKIKIYTLIFNPDSREFSGTVIFYDKNTLLGKKNFVVAAKGVKDISIDWTVNVGDHSIFATIENAKFLISDGKYEIVSISGNKTQESSRTVSKKIIPKISDAINSDFATNQIQNVQNLITENTPDFISKPMVLGAETVEEFRSSVGENTNNKKVELKKELEVLNSKKATPSDTKIDNNKILKPWKYVQYFFMTLLSFIFNNKIIFYPISAILVFLLLRFIWRKIF
jgi:hypothetical protein